MADKVANFGIRVEATAPGVKETASSVDALQKQIASSQDAVKNYAGALRGLRGSSDEVKAAKEKLKAAQVAEKDAISRATLALLKQGTTLDEVKKKQKEAEASSGKLTGVLGALQSKVNDFREALSTSNGRLSLMANLLAGAAAAAVAAGVAIAAGAVSLASWALNAGNALRTMGLFREAALGSEQNARAMGNQIEALGDKIATPREELNKLAVEQARALVGTRLTGQGIVDTFNAVAQASAAMGDSAGKQIEGLIERSKTFGRMGLGLNELQGTGIEFTDVAGALAKNLKIGIDQAQMQLRMGTVNVNAGAKALRDTVEKRFGSVNAKRLLDLNVIATKFHDRLAALTKDINLEPILRGFDSLAKMFDRSTVTGAALKDLVTDFGTAAGKLFEKAIPVMQEYFETGVIYALKFEVAALKLDAQLSQLFGDTYLSKIWQFVNPLNAIKLIFQAIGHQVEVLTDALARLSGVGFAGLSEKTKEIGKGAAGGIGSSQDGVEKAAKSMAEGANKSFRDTLGIHSPSKVFEEHGRNIAEGAAGGIDEKRGAVAKSAERMAQGASASGGAQSGGNGSAATVNATLNVSFPNVKDGAGAAKALSEPQFRAMFQKMLQEINVGG